MNSEALGRCPHPHLPGAAATSHLSATARVMAGMAKSLFIRLSLLIHHPAGCCLILPLTFPVTVTVTTPNSVTQRLLCDSQPSSVSHVLMSEAVFLFTHPLQCCVAWVLSSVFLISQQGYYRGILGFVSKCKFHLVSVVKEVNSGVVDYGQI